MTRPRALTWAVVLLIVSAVPWTLVFLDNTVAAVREPVYGGSEGGLLLLNLGYLGLVLTLPGGRRGALWTVTVGTVLFDVAMAAGTVTLFAEGQAAVALLSLFTILTSGAGLVLLWSPAARDHLEFRRAR
ncbi:hypothetical protein JCM9533A_83470 [Catenuloplanes niger JCM 9533]